MKKYVTAICIAVIGCVLFMILFMFLLTDRYQVTPLEVERMPVGIKVGEEGYYSVMADVELVYYKGEIAEVYMENPVLLAFRVSENWDGGAVVYDYAEVERIIAYLKTLNYDCDDLIEFLEHGLILTEAAT